MHRPTNSSTGMIRKPPHPVKRARDGQGSQVLSTWETQPSTPQEDAQALRQPIGTASPTFPDDQCLPALSSEVAQVPTIPGLVQFELREPEVLPSRWRRRSLAAMPMPETPVNEHHTLQPRKNEIGTSWKLTNVQTIAISHAVNQPAHDHLRRRVPLRNGRHDLTALLCRDHVHLGSSSLRSRRSKALLVRVSLNVAENVSQVDDHFVLE